MKESFQKYPELELFLNAFSELISATIKIHSIILFGGITIDDFSKKYSDIDLVIILKNGWTDSDKTHFFEILSKLDKKLANILYVYFIPKCILNNSCIDSENRQGYVYGNLKGKDITNYPLSIMDNFNIKISGEILFGENLIDQFPNPSEDIFWNMFKESLPYIEKASEIYPFQNTEKKSDSYTVNWLLYFPRLLYSLENKMVIGKSKGAIWASERYSKINGDFIQKIGSCREENRDLSDIKEIVKNSRELLLFSLSKAFELKGFKLQKIKDYKNMDRIGIIDFNEIFEEIRSLEF